MQGGDRRENKKEERGESKTREKGRKVGLRRGKYMHSGEGDRKGGMNNKGEKGREEGRVKG